MTERKFFESEALIDTLAASSNRIGVEFDANVMLDRLGQEKADFLNDAILDALKQDDWASEVEILQTNPPPKQARGFGLRLRKSVKDGQIEKVSFFRVKESLKSAAFTLIGFALALWATSPTAILSGSSLLLTAWRNFVVLKSPKNDLEIRAYEALIRVQIKKMQESDIPFYYPSTEEIHLETGNENRKDTVLGLTRLLNLKLIEAKRWGDRPYDHTNMKNLWYQTF